MAVTHIQIKLSKRENNYQNVNGGNTIYIAQRDYVKNIQKGQKVAFNTMLAEKPFLPQSPAPAN